MDCSCNLVRHFLFPLLFFHCQSPNWEREGGGQEEKAYILYNLNIAPTFTGHCGRHDVCLRTQVHSIFICLNSHLGQFYFYDINLKAVVKADSPSALIDVFLDYIQKAHADYLSPEIIWRFESKLISFLNWILALFADPFLISS